MKPSRYLLKKMVVLSSIGMFSGLHAHAAVSAVVAKASNLGTADAMSGAGSQNELCRLNPLAPMASRFRAWPLALSHRGLDLQAISAQNS